MALVTDVSSLLAVHLNWRRRWLPAVVSRDVGEHQGHLPRQAS